MRQCSALRVSTGRMPRLYCCCCWAGRVMLLSQVVAAGLGETLAASWRRARRCSHVDVGILSGQKPIRRPRKKCLKRRI